MSEILDKIKRRGHWEVIIRPTIYKDNFIESTAKCKEIIRELKVSLRGWEFPFYPDDKPPTTGLDFIEHPLDWSYFVEYWRYYQNGMFVHCSGLVEDWQDQVSEDRRWKLPNGKSLSILSTLYKITEIFEFASRLANKGLLGNECIIYINLHDTRDRKLFMLDIRRHILAEYICAIEKIDREYPLTIEELIANSSKLSLDHTIWLFQRFNWDNPPESVLKEDQEKLLRGLI